MSSQQKTAHVTGLNFPFVNTLPIPGAAFALPGGGAPGILGNIGQGFTVAVAIHLASQVGNAIWNVANLNALENPLTEFICGGFAEAGAGGWAVTAVGGAQIGASIGGAVIGADANTSSDQIAMFSYIPNASLYDSSFAAQNVAQAAINGEFVRKTTGQAQNYAFNNGVGVEFAIGGIAPASQADFASSDPTAVGGCYRSAISGVWVTPGVPSIEQARGFMEDSMAAGRLVPRPFYPVRSTAAATVAPSTPQGYHWDAADLPSQLVLGTPWVDKISGLELQLLGRQVGSARVIARDPQYTLNTLLQQG